jgi:hypothetical protein
MADRQNTIVCTFDVDSPRISAHEIHEWIFATLKIPEQQVLALQVDVFKRQVYINLRSYEQADDIITRIKGQASFTYLHGERYPVTIDLAGLGRKKLRVVNMAPEVNNEYLRTALAPYGQVLDILNEKWTQKYRNPLDNGVRVVTIHLKQHAPSHVTVAGQRTLISYEGQPTTCYGCGATGHILQQCPTRNRPDPVQRRLVAPTYSGAVRGNADVTRTRENIIGTHQDNEKQQQEGKRLVPRLTQIEDPATPHPVLPPVNNPTPPHPGPTTHQHGRPNNSEMGRHGGRHPGREHSPTGYRLQSPTTDTTNQGKPTRYPPDI